MNGQNTLSRPANRIPRGFTLMELMVVITIIGVLASIAIPAAKGILDRAHQAVARNSATQLKNAITAYYTEYRRYPTRDTGPEYAANPILSDHTLMDILLSSKAEQRPGGLNPRRHIAFSDRKARPIGNGQYRSGVHYDEQGGGTLWDPWGQHYRVVFDLDYDGKVPAPAFVTDSPFIPGSVIVWSAGKDLDDSEATDNVSTW